MTRQSEAGAPDSGLLLRPANQEDLPEVQTIYGHHVRHGLASFEEEPPDLAEITKRHAATLHRNLPFIVAERDGQVVGYSYAAPYRSRPAYRYTLEGTVYVAPECPRQGIGRALLEALLHQTTAAGYRRMVAVIGDSANQPSIRLHQTLGFQQAGLIRSVGFKFGRWVDSVIMERPLGEGDASLPE